MATQCLFADLILLSGQPLRLDVRLFSSIVSMGCTTIVEFVVIRSLARNISWLIRRYCLLSVVLLPF